MTGSPREEWVARARKAWKDCASILEVCGTVEPPPGGGLVPCKLHEAIATGLAQAFYNGVRAGLADLPDEGPVTKRLVEG